MKVREFMERLGETRTGIVVALIKDGLMEIALKNPQKVIAERYDIKKDKRFYNLPDDAISVVKLRCKNQLNSEDEYMEIPRIIGEPAVGDPDNG